MPETMTLAGPLPDGAQSACQLGETCANSSESSQYPLSTSLASSASSSSLWFGATRATARSASPSTQTELQSSTAAPGFKTLIHGDVPHCRQYFSWDCGLACAQMVLHSCGYQHCDYALLRQLCSTTSIWTVDLAHLLRRFNLAVSFYTITLGPNPAYANESFYMEHMEDDELRVSRLFLEAAAVGIAVLQRSVSNDELQSWMLSGDCLIIVLVDKRKLDPWLMAADMCLPALCGMELGYAGHYVLLIGFDGTTQEFLVRDPAAHVPDLRVSAAALDAARRSFGTDEDILVVGRGSSAGLPLQRVHRSGSQARAEGAGSGAGAGHSEAPIRP